MTVAWNGTVIPVVYASAWSRLLHWLRCTRKQRGGWLRCDNDTGRMFCARCDWDLMRPTQET